MKREERKKDIENRIIDAILCKLEYVDFKLLTADEIAKEANISKRTLYKYYESKNDMYLALIKKCFKELKDEIYKKLQKISADDYLSIVETIGLCYLDYSLNREVKGRLVATYNETEFADSFPERVKEISDIANYFELKKYVKAYYDKEKIDLSVSLESIVMFLWSNIQGLSMLLLSKESWLVNYYGINKNKMIEENMILIINVLRGRYNEGK